MKIESSGMEIHVKITVEDVDQAVKDWFASRGFTATQSKWVKTSEKKPTKEGVYIISCVTHNCPWVTVAVWETMLQIGCAREAKRNGTKMREEWWLRGWNCRGRIWREQNGSPDSMRGISDRVHGIPGAGARFRESFKVPEQIGGGAE